MRARACLVIALAAAHGCALGPDFEAPEVPQPAAFSEGAEGESIANLPWWEVFDDPVLHDLIDTALERNQDILTAAYRVDEAAAALGFTRAEQFPAFGIAATGARTEPSQQLGIPAATTDDYAVYASIAWEVDLWGRLRRSTESARADLLSVEAAQQGVIITVAATVAELYFQLRDLDNRLEISQRTVASRGQTLELIRTRFNQGIVSELDVRQAEIEEATAAATVPVFERNIIATENALAVLLGGPPGAIPRGAPLSERIQATAPAGLPAELLLRRPDIREAEEQAHAQMAQIGVAEALRWPTLTLNGALGLEADDFDNLSDDGADFWSVGANLLGPLFEFGRNARRVDVERARTEQAILRYERTVLVAYKEVEDSLAALRTGAAEYEARRRQLESARAAARLSRARYDGGVTSYLEVLDSERSLFNAELLVSSTLQQRYAALVQLYKALGAGWPATE